MESYSHFIINLKLNHNHRYFSKVGQKVKGLPVIVRQWAKFCELKTGERKLFNGWPTLL